MNLADRAKNILLAPKAEWSKVDTEAASVQSIVTGYVLILAALAPAVTIVVSFGHAILAAIGEYIIALAMTILLAFVADALATSFEGSRNFVKSLALVAYSWTAVWIAGAIAALIPAIAPVLMLAATIYAFYTFYLGAPVLGRASAAKAAAYTIVFVLCAIVLAAVLGAVLMPALFGTSMMGMGRMWV